MLAMRLSGYRLQSGAVEGLCPGIILTKDCSWCIVTGKTSLTHARTSLLSVSIVIREATRCPEMRRTASSNP